MMRSDGADGMRERSSGSLSYSDVISLSSISFSSFASFPSLSVSFVSAAAAGAGVGVSSPVEGCLRFRAGVVVPEVTGVALRR